MLFRSPKPFARVRVAYGIPLTMDDSTEDASRTSHERFQQALAALTGETRIAMAEPA